MKNVKDVKSGISRYRNCTVSYTIQESNGKYTAHAQIVEHVNDNIETVWSDEEAPFPSQGEAEVGIINLAKKIVDDLFEK